MSPKQTGSTAAECSRHLYSIEYQQTGRARTPDTNQSVIDLYRSYSNGGIVAFVGSGASASLGHCSWEELATGLAGQVDNAINELIEKIGTSNKPPPESDPNEKAAEELRAGLEKIRLTLTQASGKKKDDKEKLDTFDVLSITANALQRSVDLAGDCYGEMIKEHVREHYKNQFSVKTSRMIDKSFIASVRKKTRRYSKEVNAILAAIERLVVQTVPVPVNQKEAKSATSPKRKTRACRLVPVDHAVGIDLLWALTGDTREKNKPASVDHDPNVLLKCPLPSIDVLGTLRTEWKIGRYVTLNFDHEIERMLERTDYPFNSLTDDRHEPEKSKSNTPAQRQSAAHQVERAAEQSRLGARARVVDLNKENSAELMLFAANSPAGTMQVLHLHGSKHRPEDMIITDGDYNRRYYANDAAATVLSDGQELLFRANAIIFVGVGMKEDELLRASRILAQAPGREARPIYALMAYEGEAKNQALRVKLYQRYGIHVLFYGSPLKGEHDEEGSHHQHLLVQAAASCVMESNDSQAGSPEQVECLKKIAENLQPISKERDFLKKLKSEINGEASQTGDCIKQDLALIGEYFRSGVDRKVLVGHDVDAIKDTVPMKWPRLTLTPWHNQVFRLICRMVERNEKAQKAALLKAIDGLESAIMGRALTDALQHLSAKAMVWKKRWQDRPQIDGDPWRYYPKDSELLFRRKTDIKGGLRFAHNVSHDHTQTEGRRRERRELLESMLNDAKGETSYKDLSDQMSPTTVVIANRKNGNGKGVIATKFAFLSDGKNGKGSKKKEKDQTARIVVSFGASCSRDSMLDLISDLLVDIVKDRPGKEEKIEVVLSRFDLLFTKSEDRPKLVEWQLFMNSLFSQKGISFLLLCSGEEVSNYFNAIAEGGEIKRTITKDVKVGPPLKKTYDREDPVGKKLFAIASRCGCVWAASFLSALHAEIVLNDDDGVDIARKNAFFGAMMGKMWHALNQTQDPQQRTPALLDVAISELENYIYSYRNYESRRTKVLAHAILKHLFAFGGPVAGTVLRSCPEIRRIFDDYAVKIVQEQGKIEKAIEWLLRLDMITELYDCFVADTRKPDRLRLRYGLHGHMRNYLAVKKGLPFSMVLGREQTAMTLLPIIDEEVVPLQPADYDFIWDLFDSLVRVEGREEVCDTASDPENIRAAFMLLRGSMRVGTVLRARNEPGAGEEIVLTPLDRYFRSLLAIRHAILQWASCKGQESSSRPLYEREWVWLFNEMGVVKLLQGHVDDASSFFEQAAEFERDRIRRKNGYEWFENRMAALSNSEGVTETVTDANPEEAAPNEEFDIHAQHFTIGLCRILLNLAISEIERGAFDRAERLLRGRRIDFEKIEDKFMRKQEGGRGNDDEEKVDPARSSSDDSKKGKRNRPHREMRLLKLVCSLVEARVKFLSGASGETAQRLRKIEEDVVAEGVPGLTSWYYLIRADIEVRKGNLKDADSYFKTAHAEAEASGRSDLILSVMIGESQSDLMRQRYHSGVRIHYHLSRIHEIKQEARRMGMARVLVSASMTRARLYLSLGEYRSARYDMMSAIALSNANGLNIKRVSSLILMAALVGSMGDDLRGEAQDIADAARFEADRIGYQLAAMNATELEIVLREGGSIEDWAAGQVRSDAAHSGRVEWLD